MFAESFFPHEKNSTRIRKKYLRQKAHFPFQGEFSVIQVFFASRDRIVFYLFIFLHANRSRLTKIHITGRGERTPLPPLILISSLYSTSTTLYIHFVCYFQRYKAKQQYALMLTPTAATPRHTHTHPNSRTLTGNYAKQKLVVLCCSSSSRGSVKKEKKEYCRVSCASCVCVFSASSSSSVRMPYQTYPMLEKW